jgi:hypothetical protein
MRKAMLIIIASHIVLFLIIVAIGLWNIDREKDFKGYIVGKDFIPAGQCHDGRATTVYCGFFAYVPMTKHTHVKEKEQYIWHIANKDKTIKRWVSKDMFHSKKCGEHIIVKEFGNLMLSKFDLIETQTY